MEQESQRVATTRIVGHGHFESLCPTVLHHYETKNNQGVGNMKLIAPHGTIVEASGAEAQRLRARGWKPVEPAKKAKPTKKAKPAKKAKPTKKVETETVEAEIETVTDDAVEVVDENDTTTT